MMRAFMICSSHQILFKQLNWSGWGEWGIREEWGRKKHTGFWWENLKEGDNFENVAVRGRIILN